MDGIKKMGEVQFNQAALLNGSTKTQLPDFEFLIDAARKGFEHITKPRCMSCGASLIDDPVEDRWSCTTTEGVEIASGSKRIWTCPKCEMTTTYFGASE